MDAVKFIEEARRMCQTYDGCEDCPANACGNVVDCRVDIMQTIDAADAAAIVEKWSKEHPIKTRNSEFLKRYPDALLSREGNVFICPQLIDTHYNENLHCSERDCADCKAEYWMQEVE